MGCGFPQLVQILTSSTLTLALRTASLSCMFHVGCYGIALQNLHPFPPPIPTSHGPVRRLTQNQLCRNITDLDVFRVLYVPSFCFNAKRAGSLTSVWISEWPGFCHNVHMWGSKHPCERTILLVGDEIKDAVFDWGAQSSGVLIDTKNAKFVLVFLARLVLRTCLPRINLGHSEMWDCSQ